MLNCCVPSAVPYYVVPCRTDWRKRSIYSLLPYFLSEDEPLLPPPPLPPPPLPPPHLRGVTGPDDRPLTTPKKHNHLTCSPRCHLSHCPVPLHCAALFLVPRGGGGGRTPDLAPVLSLKGHRLGVLSIRSFNQGKGVRRGIVYGGVRPVRPCMRAVAQEILLSHTGSRVTCTSRVFRVAG